MEDRDKRMLADWARHPGADVARRWLIDQRDLYFKNLAKTLYENPDTVSEHSLREKASFFRGAFRVLNEASFASKQLTPDNQEGDTA